MAIFYFESVFFQQYNAKPHLDFNKIRFLEVRKDGIDVHLCCQPVNNMIRKSWIFVSLELLIHFNTKRLIYNWWIYFNLTVEKTFDIFPTEDLNNVFLTLHHTWLKWWEFLVVIATRFHIWINRSWLEIGSYRIALSMTQVWNEGRKYCNGHDITLKRHVTKFL